MSTALVRIDRFAVGLTDTVLKYRWVILALTLLTALAAGYGGQNLAFESNYRVFFSKENPELAAFEEFQAVYTKNDNVLVVLEPASGDVFTQDVFTAIETITEAGWQTPYVLRVDSLTNFQHTEATGDDLVVEDLVENASALTDEALARVRDIALAEPLLVGQLVTPDARATAVNIVLQYPELALTEVPEVMAVMRDLRDQIEAAHPDIAVHLGGLSALNNAFAESGQNDVITLIPAMYLILLAALVVVTRSITGTVATLFVILFSTVIAMGVGGWFGVGLTPISASAPTIILTLAIADSVHILVSVRSAMREGKDKRTALIEAMRINFLAVSITSITTIIGFLALNFSDSPPFWHLGNITAVGIAAAWVLSVTLLPAVVSLLPMRVKPADTDQGTRAMSAFAGFVINRWKVLLPATAAFSVVLIALMPTLEFNDEFTKYFDERVEFRRDSDAISPYFGVYQIEFSVPAEGPGGINEPEFLTALEGFTAWAREQPGVSHVYSLADIMKRLNKNLNADDPDFYRIPEDRELAAQYLLLYELSLPYGLDLNDRINIDKSATRVTATLNDVSTREAKAFINGAQDWLRENAPEYMLTRPTGASVMFTYITDRNVQNMIRGTLIAVAAIAVVMMLALRSFGMGLMSLIPNSLPILATFGAWAVLVGTVGFSVATVAAVSLGIVVDDTVHFLTKYLRGRRERGLSVADAVRYSFETVGWAIVVNTIVLVIGFAWLATSSFKLNADMGLMTALAITLALILDFLLLPALLLWGARFSKTQGASDAQDTALPA
ncbi:MAG: RND family transporter [Maricaulaceae bacterium]